MGMKLVTKRIRKPVCLRCEFGYPVELVPDMKNKKYVCPLCGYTITFANWMFGE